MRVGGVVLGAIVGIASACAAPRAQPVAVNLQPRAVRAPERARAGVGAPAGEVNWETQTPTECPASPVADAGTIESQDSTVDWAELDGGVAPSPSASQVRPGTARVVAGMRSGFLACYQGELRRDREAAGQVRLSIKVGCDGSVIWIRSTSQQLSKQLVECMLDRVRRAQFEPPEGGWAIIAFPVNFVKDDTTH